MSRALLVLVTGRERQAVARGGGAGRALVGRL